LHLSNAAQSRGVINDFLALLDPDGPGQQLSEWTSLSSLTFSDSSELEYVGISTKIFIFKSFYKLLFSIFN